LRRSTKIEDQFAKRIDERVCQIVSANKKCEYSQYLFDDLQCLLQEYQSYRNKLEQEYSKNEKNLMRIVGF